MADPGDEEESEEQEDTRDHEANTIDDEEEGRRGRWWQGERANVVPCRVRFCRLVFSV